MNYSHNRPQRIVLCVFAKLLASGFSITLKCKWTLFYLLAPTFWLTTWFVFSFDSFTNTHSFSSLPIIIHSSLSSGGRGGSPGRGRSKGIISASAPTITTTTILTHFADLVPSSPILTKGSLSSILHYMHRLKNTANNKLHIHFVTTFHYGTHGSIQ